ncbi:DUF2313 domain-containing protein [Serratia marcescens]|uniref:YmfQ family protein n=1 Tax=Serratia TaxID=613 RepID=UPI00254C3CEE|nr:MULTISPECIES: putative phage tail protein [Serratia]MDP8603952.1 DUF2313 domain-containing protein [Serratia marcescens]MDP8613081.1 DUF2313 domain-containing protein [Serratia marcescens]MDP8655963.1 DUF2313 domain-containing protein [Serratia marcescens]MDP8660947.1 DUF2313 domain-containing protein [Serratia marcescens]MDP8720187.1 DUF2313 domain-containing protein [Serratia marcescens]
MTITPHQQAFLQLLPNGLAWDKRPDAPLSDLSLALSTSMGAADAIGDQLLAERFPNNATLLLEDWERFLGLPDCAGEDATIQTRQIAAANKMRMVGSLNKYFYEDLARQYGYDIELTPSDDGQYTTDVNVKTGVTYRNATVLDNCLTPLRVYDAGTLECLLERYKPAHQVFKFIYPD